MTDETTIIAEVTEAPALPEPSAPSEPAPAELPPAESAAPIEVPVETSAPAAPEPTASVEVISVDELLGRLLEEDGETPAETEAPEETELPSATGIDDGSTGGFSSPLEVIGMTEALTRLKTIEVQTRSHPMLTTSFQDYTVTEGLLLLLLLAAFAAACVKMLKGGFAWLR